MSHPLYTPELREMLAENDEAGLRTMCETFHPATIAETLDDEFEPDEIWKLLGSTDLRGQAAIFEYLPMAQQVELAEGPARPKVARLLGKMSHDDRVDLLRRLPDRAQEALLRLVDAADRKDIATLNSYEEQSVGSIMTTDYSWLPPHLTAAEAIDQLRQQAPDKETIYYVYVLGDPLPRDGGGVAPRRLLGIVSLRDLILAPRHARVVDLMEDQYVSLKGEDDRSEAAEILARYDFIAIPVLDANGGLVGIVTHDDVLDVIQQEATEDLQRQAAVGPIDGTYLEAGFGRVWYNRVKWLAVLFFAQMFTINVMATYEDDLKAVAALAAFVPLCLSVGGNTGSQAATLVIRALALDEIALSDWFRIFRRELLMGAALAASLGVLAVGRTWFMTPESLASGPDVLTKLTWVISLSVIGICLWGTLLGSMLPLGIRAVGFDPALISSPAIATLSDISGILIYFTIAAAFFF